MTCTNFKNVKTTPLYTPTQPFHARQHYRELTATYVLHMRILTVLPILVTHILFTPPHSMISHTIIRKETNAPNVQQRPWSLRLNNSCHWASCIYHTVHLTLTRRVIKPYKVEVKCLHTHVKMAEFCNGGKKLNQDKLCQNHVTVSVKLQCRKN